MSTFLFLFLFVLDGKAEGVPSCLDEVRVSRLLEDYAMKQAPPPKSPPSVEPTPIVFDRCDASTISYRVVEALLFLQDVKSLSSGKDDFDQNILGDSPERYFKERVRNIIIENPETGSCMSNSLAWASTKSGENVMHVCPRVVNFSNVMLTGMLVHEARHFDGEYGHTICTRGELSGDFACDPSYETKGAYAAETELYVRLTRDSSQSADVRLEARGFVINRLVNRFDKFSLGIKESAMLTDDQGVAYLYDGDKSLVPFIADISKNAIFSIRGNLPLLFDREAGEVYTLLSQKDWVKTDGPFAQIIRQLPIEERRQALDIHYGKNACLLFPTEVLCKRDTVLNRLKLPEGFRAKKFVIMGKVMGLDDLMLIVGEDGTMYSQPYAINLADWKTEGFDLLENLHDFLGLGMMPGFNRIAILMDGALGKMAEGEKVYKPIPQFADRKFTSLNTPFYWSERFSEL